MDGTTLSGLVRARIKKLGISQRAYATKVGLSSSHLNSLIKGRITLPRPDVRRRLAEDLGLTHLDLLVMAGEIMPWEIPAEGAMREPFPKGTPHAKAVEFLHELDHASALEVARFCLFQIEHPVVEIPVMVAALER